MSQQNSNLIESVNEKFLTWKMLDRLVDFHCTWEDLRGTLSAKLKLEKLLAAVQFSLK